MKNIIQTFARKSSAMQDKRQAFDDANFSTKRRSLC